ncbi:unnamed protein product [Scytosiphon promiscuus]
MASTDRSALVALLRATGGTSAWLNSTNWDTDAELSKWYGVEVDGDGRVVKLSLAANHLRGNIPPELASLAALQTLDLNSNELQGEGLCL